MATQKYLLVILKRSCTLFFFFFHLPVLVRINIYFLKFGSNIKKLSGVTDSLWQTESQYILKRNVTVFGINVFLSLSLD